MMRGGFVDHSPVTAEPLPGAVRSVIAQLIRDGLEYLEATSLDGGVWAVTYRDGSRIETQVVTRASASLGMA